MKRPYLSVVVPAYNTSVSCTHLLDSLRLSQYNNFEVIIGDDGSFEPIEVLCRDIVVRCSFPVVFVRLEQNIGPAGARNVAAKRAKGTILVFLDSDVEVYSDTLQCIADAFKKDLDLVALTGVWDKHQRTSKFFPQYKALRDWSYWMNERDRDGYYYLFSTRIAAIKKNVFERLRGFDTTFRQMEDVEFTYRVARRYAIVFFPTVRVHHEFEDFWPVAKKYFWRSFYWTKLYKVRRKFDPVATTRWESFAALTAFGFFITLVAATILFFIYPSAWIRKYSIGAVLIFLLMHTLLIRKFLLFVYQEKGWWFMIRSFIVGIVLYCIIVFGSIYFFVQQALNLQKEAFYRDSLKY